MSILAQHADPAHSSDWAFKQLFKLESECRSQTPALQVQAIGQFSKLLDQFPFPTLVSSAFLKLGDLFRSSPNSLRYHIAQVFESSQHHLTQITHAEELLKRIIAVLYSNDPIARVLALRLIGNASVVFAKYPEAQHGVLLRYTSGHPLEIGAAVQATELMLKYSPELLDIVWETVISKANDASVLDSVRAQLIRSLRHAASNLQLSVRLYGHCRSWLCNPESTTVVKAAALGTWGSIIQPHNELKIEDAVTIAGFVSHSVMTICRVSLALLAKWRHNNQKIENFGHTEISTIKEYLCAYINDQLSNQIGAIDFRCVRLAVITLARMEATVGYTDTPRCWQFADALAEWSLNMLWDTVSEETSALDYAHRNISDVNPDDTKCREYLPLVSQKKIQQLKQRISYKPHSGQASMSQLYCALVQSTMITINVATVLKDQTFKRAASDISANVWRAFAQIHSLPCRANHTKRFLETSWRWCKSMGTEKAIANSFQEMLSTRNEYISQAIMIILSSEKALANQLAANCLPSIERFVDVLGSSKKILSSESQLAWQSITAVLTHQIHLLDCAQTSNPSDSGISIAAEAVIRWSLFMHFQTEGSRLRSTTIYSNSGPPAYLCQRIMTLLACCGDWSALSHFCGALLMVLSSNNLREWIHTISMFAKAENMLGDQNEYINLIDHSLRSLRILDSRANVRHVYQHSIIELRKEFVNILSSWQLFRPMQPIHPSSIHAVKSLIQQTLSLANQTNYVCSAFVCIDRITEVWLDDMQATLSNIIRAITACDHGINMPYARILAISDAVQSVLSGKGIPPLRIGSSFFSRPTNPDISIGTRPDLEADGAAVVVYSGSQFHFTVEGFVRFPAHNLSIAPQRVRVSVWLSQQSLNSVSTYDLQLQSEYSKIAWGDEYTAQAYDTIGVYSKEDSPWNALWNKATVFEANIDAAYFACSCAITMPSLHLIFGQGDSNMTAYIHVFCALVDLSDHTWYIGPHKSYPLTISTTARS
ncbi:hypothetical protein GGI25_004006 [Coemansia spiralis]|uniref:Integrator complex subunit 7 N-terminal domain-containing protein n=2 Tax=Coemansia TaxID=4863 RepID=A0A9W8G7D4_9FUNG|nr:hypothetical protein EDC05_004281 [Coemansia umbellata]KAJ2623803.1 hypothetical protein GGI26_002041 [Coemansia sp. RSA 1358]KAJ2675268.1 hypothetical protein GGI25_004006 [Coemansia spiralis]